MGSSNCGLVKMYDSRRTSYSSSRSASTVSTSSMSFEAGSRKQSLREMPSYRVEASKALNRRDDLKDLKKRLSSNRDLLNADHASKPWLKFRSISQKSFEDSSLCHCAISILSHCFSLQSAMVSFNQVAEAQCELAC